MDQVDLRQSYKTILKSNDGVKVMADLERRYFIKCTTFSNESNEMAYCEGQRTVILFLQSMLQDEIKREEVAEI